MLIQAGSLREDFCALAKATNLVGAPFHPFSSFLHLPTTCGAQVLSFSTLGDNAAVPEP